MGFAREVNSKVVFLHKGEIEEQGAPDELLFRPRSERLQALLSNSLKQPGWAVRSAALI